jgi:hypothetical protein
MRYLPTCSNPFINFLFAVTIFTNSSLSSTSFQIPRASFKCTHAYCSNFDVIVFCGCDLFFDYLLSVQGLFCILVNMYCDWLLWYIINTSMLRGNSKCRTECIVDGSASENKRNSLQRNGGRGAK